MSKLFVLRGVLASPSKHNGWLCLKGIPALLNSECLFYVANLELSPEEEVAECEETKNLGWISTISRGDIEDIVGNVDQ
ncbi:hypothetical protein [Jeongeupia sp. USM3]|uniref:DUF7716 domain-containing protein n=1 Tax=Jeongeupia sp. USM3 TaxID=1906741 RepID=UPI0011AB620A|nr:hypothetical protein [Jeongeupia sp. USM3]